MNALLHITAVTSFAFLVQASIVDRSSDYAIWDDFLFKHACSRRSFIEVRKICNRIAPIPSRTTPVQTQLTLCEDTLTSVTSGMQVNIPGFSKTMTCAITFFEEDVSTSSVSGVLSASCSFEQPFEQQSQLSIQVIEPSGNFLVDNVAGGTKSFKLDFFNKPFVLVVKITVIDVGQSSPAGSCTFQVS